MIQRRPAGTQDELAKAVGLVQHHVSRLLTFGRFLAIIPAGINSAALTERAFRSLWEQTTTHHSFEVRTGVRPSVRADNAS